MMEGPIGSDILAQRFLKPAEINASLETLSKEGFKLWKIEKVADTAFYTLILRRPLATRMQPMRAPTEFIGVYQVQAPEDQTIFYALAPTYYGFTVVRFHGNDEPRMFDAKWDGGKLVCDQGGMHHVIVLAADGYGIVHAEEKVLPSGLERKVFTARRIQCGKR